MTPEEQRMLAQQALNQWTGGPMVPLAQPYDPIAQADADLAAQAQADAQFRNAPAPVAQPSFVDPASVSSMPEPAGMSMPPPQPTTQELAAQAYQTWTGSQMAGPPAPPASSGYSLAMPPPQPSAPAEPQARVTEMPPQDIVGQAAPAQAPLGARTQSRPSMLTEQGMMAEASRDEATQAKDAADANLAKQADLARMSGKAEAENASMAVALAEQQQAEIEESGRLVEQQRAVKAAAEADVTSQYKKLNEEAAATQIADRRSTGQRVMGMIALALGGMQDQNNLVAGLKQGLNVQTHNADQVMQMVNAAIERDLAIQRANLDNKRASADAKYSEVGLARNAIKDVDAQGAAAQSLLEKKYAAGFAALKAQGLGEQASITGDMVAEKLLGQSAERDALNAEALANKEAERLFQLQVQAEQERKAAARAAARGAQRDPMVAELVAKEQAGTITAPELKMLLSLRGDQKKLDGDAGGEPVVAPKGRELRDPSLAKQSTKEQRAKFAETENVTNALESKIDKLLKLREKHGIAVGTWQTDAYKEAQTLNKEIMLGLKKKEELGTLDNQSERFLNEMTGDPNAWFINTPETQLNAIKRAGREDVEMRAQGLGYSSALDQRDEYASKYGARER